MRVLVVDTYYPAFVEAHYAARPGLAEQSYDEQLRSLIDRSFGTADAYSHAFRELGHEAIELVASCAPLQRRWAVEHGRGAHARALALELPGRAGRATRITALRAVAQAQIDDFDPDVVYVQDIAFFGRRDLDRLRRRGRLVAGQVASEPPGAGVLRGYDLLLTSFPHFVERFRALGVGSEYLRLAFDPRVLERLRAQGVDPSPGAARDIAVGFVGGVNPRVHPGGVALLERLAEAVPLEVWGYGADALAADSPLRTRHRGEAWGLDMYATLARTRITINRHIEAAEGLANNMRLFEATGVGSLVLTEAAPNLADLFAPGTELVAYEGEADLIEKVRHYVEHDDERRAVAAAGQARTLAEHTYGDRIAELAGMLESRLGPRR